MSRQLGPGSRVSGLFLRENLGPICLDSRIPPYEIDDDDDDWPKQGSGGAPEPD